MSLNDRPTKVLSYKTYDKIPHFLKSRVGDADHHIDKKSEEYMTKTHINGHYLLIVQEKIDGSNCCVVRHKGKLIPLSRAGYACDDSPQEQHRMFYRWVMLHYDRFDKLLQNEDDRIVGEWIAMVHSTKYIVKEDPFIVFDLFIKNVRCVYHDFLSKVLPLSFSIPPLIHLGSICNLNKALKMLREKSPNDDQEGLVYRLEHNGKFKLIVKYVKHDKEDGKYLKEGCERIWNWSDK